MGKFITRCEVALRKVPVAAFPVVMTPFGKDPVDRDNAMKKLEKPLNP